jgi:hypothetical protein
MRYSWFALFVCLFDCLIVCVRRFAQQSGLAIEQANSVASLGLEPLLVVESKE